KEQFDDYLELTGFDLIVYEPLAVDDELEDEYEDDDDLPLEQLLGGGSKRSDNTSQKYLIYQLDKLYPSKIFEPEKLQRESMTEQFEYDSLELAQLYYDHLNASENGYSECEARQVA